MGCHWLECWIEVRFFSPLVCFALIEFLLGCLAALELGASNLHFGSLSFVIYMMEMIMGTMSSDNAQLLSATLGRRLGHCKCYSILILYYYLVGVQRVNT